MTKVKKKSEGLKKLIAVFTLVFMMVQCIPLIALAAGTGKATIENSGDNPTIPSNLTATVKKDTKGNRYIYLKWGASTDQCSGIKQYNIYRNGAYLTSVTSNTRKYTDYKVKDGEKYQYKVVAIDGKNHTSRPNQTQIIYLEITRNIYDPITGQSIKQELRPVINAKTRVKNLAPVKPYKPTYTFSLSASTAPFKTPPIDFSDSSRWACHSNLQANTITFKAIKPVNYIDWKTDSKYAIKQAKKFTYTTEPVSFRTRIYNLQKSGNTTKRNNTTAWGYTNNYKTRYNYK